MGSPRFQSVLERIGASIKSSPTASFEVDADPVGFGIGEFVKRNWKWIVPLLVFLSVA
jgi:hypothetical protein